MSPRHDGGSTDKSPAGCFSTAQPRAVEDRGTFRRRHIEAAEARRTLGAQHVMPPPIRHGAGDHDLARLAAAQFEHQPRRDFEPGADEIGVEAALEAIARVAGDVEPAAGRGGAHRIEQAPPR